MAFADQTPSYGSSGQHLLPDPTQWITHSLLSLVDRDEQQRKDRMVLAWQAYSGLLPDPLFVEWKPGAHRQPPNDNIQINNARLIVNRGVEFLAGKGHNVEYDTADDPAEPASDTDEATPEEVAVEAFWEANGGALTFQKLAQNGAICGHAFAKLTEPLSAGEPAGLEVLDPMNVDVIWDPDDYTQVWEYRVTWTSIDPASKQPRARRERHVRDDRANPASMWTIIDEEAVQGGEWREIGSEPWPYPFAAVVDCQNLPCANEYYGISDLEPDVVGMCRSLNMAASNLNRLIRLHAHGHPWVAGVDPAIAVDFSPDKLTKFANPEAKVGILQVLGDLAGALEWYRELKQALYEVTSVPPVAVGKLESIGQLSGLALGILYGPLIAKTEQKQDTYGPLLVAITERALVIAGEAATLEDASVVVHWSELVPADPIAEREALTLDEQLGVSKATILEKLGYDPELEAQKRQVEDQEALAQAQAAFNRGDPSVDPSVQQPPPVAGGA